MKQVGKNISEKLDFSLDMAEQATEKDYMQCPGAYTFQRTDSKKEFQINPQQGQQSWNNKEHP